MELTGARRDAAAVEQDPIGLDAADLAEANDVLDASQLLHLTHAQGRPSKHGGCDHRVDAQ